MALHPQVVQDIARELEAAPRKMRAALMAWRAGLLGVSAGTLYRQVRRVLGPRRKERSDKGRPRAFTEEEAQAVAAIRAEVSGKSREPFAYASALEAAREWGVVQGAGSVSAIRRAIRAQRVDADRTPVRRWEAGRPNQVHLFDVSGANYLKPEPGPDGQWRVRVVREGDQPYKNRRREVGHSLWFYSCVDAFSRYTFMRMIIAPGESAEHACAFLTGAWARKEEEVFGGVPEWVYTDRGPFLHSDLGRAFCRTFEIRIGKHLPRAPRGKGKVERPFRTVQNQFEARYLLHEGRLIPIGEVRAAFARYLARLNAQAAHPRRKGETRLTSWRGIAGAQVRWAPADALRHVYRIERRKVSPQCIVRFGGSEYVVDGDLKGSWVDVFYNLEGQVFAASGEMGITCRAELYQDSAWGEFEAQARKPASAYLLEQSAALLPQDRPLPRFEDAPLEAERPAARVMTLPLRGAEAEPIVPFVGAHGDAPAVFVSPEAALRHLNESLPVPAWRLAPREEMIARLAADLSRGAVDRLRDEMIALYSAKEGTA